MTSAFNLVTTLYKGELPLKGEVGGFPIRKSFGQMAAEILHNEVELLSHEVRHFQYARELFLVWCERGVKESYAQFADYADAALIMSPPGGTEVAQAALEHVHIQYILRKCGAQTLVYIL